MPKVITEAEFNAREAHIVATATKLIKEQGFASLTMDKVVSKVPYAKGSVYKHFNSVEEILLAISNSGAHHLLALLERARGYSGNSRVRYIARAQAYFLYSQLHPVEFICELDAISPAVLEKASERHRTDGQSILNQFYKLSADFVDQGVSEAALTLPANISSRRIAKTSWSMEFGVSSYAIAASFGAKQDAKVNALKLQRDLCWMVNVFLDGLNWQPMHAGEDAWTQWCDIRGEVFNAEFAQLGLLTE